MKPSKDDNDREAQIEETQRDVEMIANQLKKGRDTAIGTYDTVTKAFIGAMLDPPEAGRRVMAKARQVAERATDEGQTEATDEDVARALEEENL